MYNSDLKIYYEIDPLQLPDSTVLIKVVDKSIHSNVQESVSDLPTNVSVLPSAVVNSKPGPLHLNESVCDESTRVSWPNIFQINEKNMSQTLRNALGRADLLSRKELCHLLDFLYQQITLYTYYQTPNNYEEVASALLSKYPHLLEGCKFGDAKEQWRVRLSAKARNSRQRYDKNIKVVAQKRKKLIDNEVQPSEKTTKKKMTPAFGSPHYLPNKPETEDEDSVLRHIAFLKAEIKIFSIDTRKIEISMRSSFHHRRHLLIQDGYSLVSLKEMYPVLFDSVQIMYEFIRITDVDIQTSLRVRLTEYSDALLKVSDVVYEETEDDVNISEIKVCLAAKQIPKLLKDSVDFNKKPETASPMLLFDGDVSDPNARGTLYAEGIELCKFDGIITGLSVWLASYYVFDCCYPPSCCRTLRFLQREVLGIKDKSKVSLVSSNLIQQLNILKNKVARLVTCGAVSSRLPRCSLVCLNDRMGHIH